MAVLFGTFDSRGQGPGQATMVPDECRGLRGGEEGS
jgi:hypothetical protein